MSITAVIILSISMLMLAQPASRKFDSLQVLIEKANGKNKVDLMNQQARLIEAKEANLRVELGQRIIKISSELRYTAGIVDGYNNTGVGYYMRYQIDSSLIYLLKGYDLIKGVDDPELEADLITNIGNSYERSLGFRKANEYHFNALQIREKINDSTGIALSLNNIGLNYWRLGEFVSAEGYFTRALEIRKKLEDIKGIGRILNNLGVLHWNWGHYFKALKVYLESLDARVKTDDTLGVVVTMNNLAMLYQKLGDPEKSLEYLDRSLKLSKLIKYNFGEAYSYENLGQYYMSKKDYDKALESYNRAVTSYTVINFVPGITDVNNATGDVYFSLGDCDKAKGYYSEALSQSRSIENKKGVINSLNNLGKVYIELGRIDLAQKYLSESMEMLKDERIADFLRDANRYYARLFERKGDLTNAYNYLKIYQGLSDSLFNLENSRIINDLKEKYDAEKKEKENELLRSKTALQDSELKKQNYILNLFGIALLFIVVFSAALYYAYNTKKRAKEKVDSLYEDLKRINDQLSESEKNLQELNKTKDKLFSIIAHDLKNPFLALNGYSELLYEGFDEYSDEDKKQMIADIREVSNSTFELLENLLDWARLQTGKMGFVKEKLDLSSLIKENLILIQPAIKLKMLHVLSKLDEGLEITGDREMIKTVLRNLLSNGIKFTHPGGRITISAESKNDFVHLIIEDTGMGIGSEDIQRLLSSSEFLSTKGTDGEKGSGLGLVLCQEFIQKHGGKISVESKVNEGSKFIVTLPRA
ncbi:MAG: tetratricopeptide repeat protein [Ignavibacteriaceae bacterium]